MCSFGVEANIYFLPTLFIEYVLQLILARRERHNRHNHRRPNIGHAIAGLARERNPLEMDDVGDNVEELTWARVSLSF